MTFWIGLRFFAAALFLVGSIFTGDKKFKIVFGCYFLVTAIVELIKHLPK